MASSWLKDKNEKFEKWLAERADKKAACNLLPEKKKKVKEAANSPDGPLKRNKYMNACKTAKECGNKSAVEALKEYAGKDGNFGECTVGGRKKKRKSRRRKTKNRRKTKRKSRRRKSRKTKRRRRRRRKSRR